MSSASFSVATLSVGGAIFMFCSPTQALDCAKATTPVDRVICGDPALRAQDATLSRLYFSTLRKLSGQRHDTLIEDQRLWLMRRPEECSAKTANLGPCLTENMAARMKQISACFSSAAPDIAAADISCRVAAHAACPEMSVSASASIWRYPFLVSQVETIARDQSAPAEDPDVCAPESAARPGSPDDNQNDIDIAIAGAGDGWVAVRQTQDDYSRGGAHPNHGESVTTYHSGTGREFPIKDLMPALERDTKAREALRDAANEKLDVPCCGSKEELAMQKLDDITMRGEKDATETPLPDAWSIEPGGSLKIYYSYEALGRSFVATSVVQQTVFISWVDPKFRPLFVPRK